MPSRRLAAPRGDHSSPTRPRRQSRGERDRTHRRRGRARPRLAFVCRLLDGAPSRVTSAASTTRSRPAAGRDQHLVHRVVRLAREPSSTAARARAPSSRSRARPVLVRGRPRPAPLPRAAPPPSGRRLRGRTGRGRRAGKRRALRCPRSRGPVSSCRRPADCSDPGLAHRLEAAALVVRLTSRTVASSRSAAAVLQRQGPSSLSGGAVRQRAVSPRRPAGQSPRSGRAVGAVRRSMSSRSSPLLRNCFTDSVVSASPMSPRSVCSRPCSSSSRRRAPVRRGSRDATTVTAGFGPPSPPPPMASRRDHAAVAGRPRPLIRRRRLAVRPRAGAEAARSATDTAPFNGAPHHPSCRPPPLSRDPRNTATPSRAHRSAGAPIRCRHDRARTAAVRGSIMASTAPVPGTCPRHPRSTPCRPARGHHPTGRATPAPASVVGKAVRRGWPRERQHQTADEKDAPSRPCRRAWHGHRGRRHCREGGSATTAAAAPARRRGGPARRWAPDDHAAPDRPARYRQRFAGRRAASRRDDDHRGSRRHHRASPTEVSETAVSSPLNAAASTASTRCCAGGDGGGPTEEWPVPRLVTRLPPPREDDHPRGRPVGATASGAARLTAEHTAE